jgi:DNA-binding IclR family transcriptional regulator
MPCLQSDGTLSRIGVRILQAVREPATVEVIAQASGLPLFKARSAVRGLVKAALVEKAGDLYGATTLGLNKLDDAM